LIFVSHDREFVSSLATRILEIRIDGKVINYLGNYEEYLASQGIA
jgi:ATPase subunit of ABC transporter with duplicated ATPase domains